MTITASAESIVYSNKHTQVNTVEAGYNNVPGTFKVASLYVACVITEAPDITNVHHATSLYQECLL